MQPAVTCRFLFLVFLVSGCTTPPPRVYPLGQITEGAVSPIRRETEKLLDPGPTVGGVPEGDGIVSYPKLLNRDEISGLLRRHYPERERRAGREGTVVLALHVGVDGKVGSTEVLQSAGRAFDRAAAEVAKLMRFEPAMSGKRPVAVKLPQTVVFQIER